MTPDQLTEIETVAQRKANSGVGTYVVQPELMLALVREARRAGRYREALKREALHRHNGYELAHGVVCDCLPHAALNEEL